MQNLRSGLVRRSGINAAVTILAGSVVSLATVPGHAATFKENVHLADSYGAQVNIGSTVKLGKIAYAVLPSCYVQSTGTFVASAASINQSGLVSTGVVDSTASSTATASTGSSDVIGVNLLDGVISASEIKSVSNTLVSGGLYSSNATGTIFSGLKVLGVPIAATVAPNTIIELPLIGSVVLNEQIASTSGGESKLTVNAIHVTVTAGVNKGVQIIIADAFSELKGTSAPAQVGGYAYAPELVAGPVTSGPLVLELIPCNGTSGAVETDSVAATSIPGIVSTGTVTVTGSGNVTTSETTSEATSSIAGINLLSGLLSASAITGSATGSTTDGVTFTFGGGSTFAGLSVAGHPEITADVASNTRINIANLGTLYLNRVQVFADKIKVTPIELVVSTANSLSLPIGADLTLGVVEAQLHSQTIP